MWEDDNNTEKIDDLKFNKKFAQKFEQRKRREHIEQAQTKYGKELNKMLEEEDDLESSSSSSDSEGELVTENEKANFIKIIAKIREKDPEIYQGEKKFWKDDFFDDVPINPKDKQNPIYYKDLARQALTEDAKPKKTVRELHDEEQAKLKSAFKSAAGLADDGDDLFKVKTKTEQQIEDENKEFEKFLKTEAKKSKKEELDMLQRFWGDESKLDETDKFLRKFIMTNGWIDKDKKKYNFEVADEEDERREDEMDEFEEKYNFRFEEPGADQVITYARENVDSVRQKPEKRKEKRIEKEARKKEELKQHEEEIKHLKSIRKQEVFERLAKIQSVAGSELSKKEEFNKILDKDFDPKDYDQLMEEEFGQDYYQNEDNQVEELEEYMEEQEKKQDEIPQDKDEEENKNEEAKADKQSKADADQDTLLKPKAAIPLFNRVGIKEQEAKEIADTIGHLWWYCDTCMKGIKEGEARYECLECEDFCQCKKCADMKDHPHKMKKFIVPNGCTPPSDKEIQKIVENLRFCAECSYKFTEYDFIFELKKNKEFLLCEDCMKGNQTQYKEKDFNKIKPTKVDTEKLAKEDMGKLKEIYKDQELHDLIDSYYALDFEDVISGGIKTRFKYINVDKNSYGLTDNQILYADDKVQNQFVSQKMLAPYRPDNGKVNMNARKKKKNILKKDAERNERGVVQDMKKLAKLEEKGLSKEELREEIRHKEALRAKIERDKKRKKVKLTDAKDIEGIDYDNEDEEKPAEPEETFEPQKEKKRKLNINNSRLKSYGLE